MPGLPIPINSSTGFISTGTNTESSSALRGELKNAAFILLGSTLLALGVVLFLAPNRIATGGTPGMAILLNYLLDLPTGILMLAINVPLLALCLKFLGRLFALRTIVAIVLTSAIVDLLVEILAVAPLTSNAMLATLYGGLAVGGGVGFILKGNASAGGPTTIARIISSQTRLRPGQIILCIDMLIIISVVLVFGDSERALWSMASIFITAKTIDMILKLESKQKIVHIVSGRVDQLSQLIIDNLGSSGTILSGTGLHQNQHKSMIFVVVENQRLSKLRNLVRQNDADAFMVVMEPSEMQGRGH